MIKYVLLLNIRVIVSNKIICLKLICIKYIESDKIFFAELGEWDLVTYEYNGRHRETYFSIYKTIFYQFVFQ